MRSPLLVACAVLLCARLSFAGAYAHPGPFDGKTFRGRIAWSADGNFNDPDDWASSPVALAIIAECGGKEKFVHCDYNNILPKTDPQWEKEHAAGVLGAARHYGFRESAFHDCQKDLEGAIESIKNAVNASSAEDPLYFVLAGPMEVPARGIARSDPDKRKHVFCISHNRWNDGYSSVEYVKHNKRDVIPLGVTWIQIADQNRLLANSPYGRPSRPEEWRPWEWMRDSDDAKVRFIWERTLASTRGDCSDAGMAYFLMTGDEQCDIAKLRRLLDGNVVPAPVDPRQTVRMEAENFRALDGCEVESRNDRSASQRICTRVSRGATGRIQTPFYEPYAATAGRYDVDVRHSGGRGGACRLQLLVKGQAQGPAWEAAGTDETWRTQTIPGVAIREGDEISVEVRREAGAGARVDYVQLNLLGDAGEGGWTARQIAVVEGFEAPECVVVDPATGMAYVSNIAARHAPNSREQYWAEDGTGFISRLKPGGAVDSLRWRESTPQLRMNAIKGMCLLGGQLEVNDVTQLVRIPLAEGRQGRRLSLEGAARLNDVATDGQAVYASDMAQGVVYRVEGDRARKLKAPEGVNGITFARRKMFAVSRTLHEVYEMDPAGQWEPKPFGLAAHFAGLDGIEVLADGTFLVSDIAGNKVCAISPDRATVRTIAEVESAADIGLDRERLLLYVPQLMKDRVVVYQLEKR